MSEEVTWSRKNHSQFESFALDVQDYWRSGKRIDSADKMLRTSFEKQKAAMEQDGLHMSVHMRPNGQLAEKGVSFGWKDEIFASTVECRTCALTRTTYKDDREIYKKTENVSLYVTTTDLVNRERVDLNKLHNCPGCGAAGTIGQLQDGCAYCGTRFRISDLFPVVTNLYTVREVGGTAQEMRRGLLRYCLPAMLVCIPLVCWSNLNKDPELGVLVNILAGILIGGIAGFILGYVLHAFVLLAVLFKEAGRVTPMLIATGGSRKKFVNLVRRYSPAFSYEYFTDKIVTVLRQLLSEKDLTDNPYYIGPSVDIDGASIFEYAFRGGVAVKNCRMDGARVRVTADVYMTDFYLKENKIKERNDVFRMVLSKDLSREIDYHFTLSAINCKNCGGSFDATAVKKCPYCGTAYQIGDDDWVVESVRKK